MLDTPDGPPSSIELEGPDTAKSYRVIFQERDPLGSALIYPLAFDFKLTEWSINFREGQAIRMPEDGTSLSNDVSDVFEDVTIENMPDVTGVEFLGIFEASE